MSEWWTYRPSDFLMFAPRTYWRLFAQQNEAWWPAPLLLVLAASAWALWAARRGPGSLRAGAGGLAAASAFVGWSFVLQRYAPINWAASGLAVLCFAQALGLAIAAAAPGGLQASEASGRRRAGWALLAAGVLLHPLLAPLAGRPWLQAEIFALAPDPTVVAVLGWLLLVAPPRQKVAAWALRGVWVAALAWCVASVATLWTMGSPQAVFMAAAALAALAALRFTSARPSRSPGAAARRGSAS